MVHTTLLHKTPYGAENTMYYLLFAIELMGQLFIVIEGYLDQMSKIKCTSNALRNLHFEI